MKFELMIVSLSQLYIMRYHIIGRKKRSFLCKQEVGSFKVKHIYKKKGIHQSSLFGSWQTRSSQEMRGDPLRSLIYSWGDDLC
jgi:hypothetical protein